MDSDLVVLIFKPTLCCELFYWNPGITNYEHQQNRIICKKQRLNSEAIVNALAASQNFLRNGYKQSWCQSAALVEFNSPQKQVELPAGNMAQVLTAVLQGPNDQC